MPEYPSALKSFSTRTDYVDDVMATDVNQAYEEIEAIQAELGTDVAGEATDLKTRLAQALFEAASMNTEVLSGNKTFTDTDGGLQSLDPGGTNRDVTMPAPASLNAAFVIHNASAVRDEILSVGSTDDSLISLYGGQAGFIFSDGTTWFGIIFNGTRAQQTVYLPVSFMFPETTDGCEDAAQRELTAGQPEVYAMAFDGSTDEFAQFSFGFPEKWDKGTITFRPRWCSTASDTDGVAWTLAAVATADGEPIDVAFGTPVTIVDNAQGSTDDFLTTAASAEITIAGSPGDDEQIRFRIGRDPDHASDTHAEDAYLEGIDIFYWIDAESDLV